MTDASPEAGTFYLVGMGTAPDLMTLRATEVIERTTILLVEDNFDQQAYRSRLAGKEVWVVPHHLRVFYGTPIASVIDPAAREIAERNERERSALVEQIGVALRRGRDVAFLLAGDPMMFGALFLLELLPPAARREIIPGVGAFQAATAAVQRSPGFGYDTSAVILTMADWPERTDTNERLMTSGASLVFYTMHLDFPELFAQLRRHYPADTPVALVVDAGDREREQVLRSTVARFVAEVDTNSLPAERTLLLVGKFLTVGQARKDGVQRGRKFAEAMHDHRREPELRA